MKSILAILILCSVLLSCVSCSTTDNDKQGNCDTSESTPANNENTSPNNETTSNTSESTPPNNESTSNSSNNTGLKHYEIDLTADNYQTFLNFSKEALTINNRFYNYNYILSGVLSYAYYENVVVTFDITYKYDEGDFGGEYTYQGEYSIVLNAAGNAQFKGSDQAILNAINCPTKHYGSDQTITIKKVTGKIIFSA